MLQWKLLPHQIPGVLRCLLILTFTGVLKFSGIAGRGASLSVTLQQGLNRSCTALQDENQLQLKTFTICCKRDNVYFIGVTGVTARSKHIVSISKWL